MKHQERFFYNLFQIVYKPIIPLSAKCGKLGCAGKNCSSYPYIIIGVLMVEETPYEGFHALKWYDKKTDRASRTFEFKHLSSQDWQTIDLIKQNVETWRSNELAPGNMWLVSPNTSQFWYDVGAQLSSRIRLSMVPHDLGRHCNDDSFYHPLRYDDYYQAKRTSIKQELHKHYRKNVGFLCQ
jgi:hypothetical protein